MTLGCTARGEGKAEGSPGTPPEELRREALVLFQVEWMSSLSGRKSQSQGGGRAVQKIVITQDARGFSWAGPAAEGERTEQPIPAASQRSRPRAPGSAVQPGGSSDCSNCGVGLGCVCTHRQSESVVLETGAH